MPEGLPPPAERAAPHYYLLPSGSFLWQIARTGPEGEPPGPPFRRRAPATDPAASRWGGRFDPDPDAFFPYCYAALDDLTVLSEILLRNVAFTAPERFLDQRASAGRSLVLLETRRPLWLVSLLEAADLAAAWQDTWLIHAENAAYGLTRRWGWWLRDSAGPDGAGAPDGIVWPSKRQPTGRVVLLFGDRCGEDVVRAPFERRLGGKEGLAWLDRRLSLVRTGIAPADA